MSEWKPFDTAPKDGRTVLATHETSIYAIRWIEGADCWWLIGGGEISKNPISWMEAPELPIEEHDCSGGSYDTVTCHQEDGELWMHVRGSAEIHYVLYCPFCGEKA